VPGGQSPISAAGRPGEPRGPLALGPPESGGSPLRCDWNRGERLALSAVAAGAGYGMIFGAAAIRNGLGDGGGNL
jgi:hypothetical protein